MTKRTFLGIVVLLGALGGALAAQQPQPAPAAPAAPAAAQQPGAQLPDLTFRAEVNYVEVDARVLDENGKFLGGLTAKDFQVFEDGKPQQVSIFSFVNLPVERAERPLFASKPIEPDVNTNLAGQNGRVYLIVLDDLHTNALRSQQVKAAARQFIERYVGANDLVAVLHTSGRTNASQEFTSNPRLMLSAVDKFMGRKLRSATLNKIDDEAMTRGNRATGDPINDIDENERGYNARIMLDSMRQVAQFLTGVSGRRKALVLFSEGIDYDIYDFMGKRDATTIINSTQDLIAAATRSNVAIYGVDPRGLGGMALEGIEVQSFPEDQSLGINTQSFQNELRLSQDSLRVLSDQTGGFATVNTNDFKTAFQRIVDDNSSYYVLGYYPTNDKRDGRFRKIEVKVPGHPQAQIRARKGYISARGKTPEVKPAGPNDPSVELRNAMASPLPISEIPMAATAAVFKGPAPNGSVVVSTLVPGVALPLVEKDGTFRNDLELAVTATNQSGKTFSGGRNTLNLNMRPESAKRAMVAGFRVVSSIDLPPGRYTLRIGAREANGKKAGSVSYDVEVPDFAKEDFLMSSLALTSAASSSTPTARGKDPLQQLLPGPLSTHREFPQGDEIALFAEIYDNQAKQPHKVDIRATMKAEGGQTVFQTAEERDSSELKGSAGGYGFTARIPLKDVAPGLYVIRVEAQSRLGDKAGVARETIIRVSRPEPAQ
ncbi:MAG TPA: VWA domain-containing protein [Vicinamibacterales bacterium]|nr:VWA domain-containing protein [Vicinamibacterales bacterium]